MRIEPGEVGAFDHSGKSSDFCVAKSAVSEVEASSCHAVVCSEPYEILPKRKKWKLIWLGTWHWQYSLLTQRQCQYLRPGRTFPGPSYLAKKWHPNCCYLIAVQVTPSHLGFRHSSAKPSSPNTSIFKLEVIKSARGSRLQGNINEHYPYPGDGSVIIVKHNDQNNFKLEEGETQWSKQFSNRKKGGTCSRDPLLSSTNTQPEIWMKTSAWNRIRRKNQPGIPDLFKKKTWHEIFL